MVAACSVAGSAAAGSREAEWTAEAARAGTSGATVVPREAASPAAAWTAAVRSAGTPVVMVASREAAVGLEAAVGGGAAWAAAPMVAA